MLPTESLCTNAKFRTRLSICVFNITPLILRAQRGLYNWTIVANGTIIGCICVCTHFCDRTMPSVCPTPPPMPARMGSNDARTTAALSSKISSSPVPMTELTALNRSNIFARDANFNANPTPNPATLERQEKSRGVILHCVSCRAEEPAAARMGWLRINSSEKNLSDAKLWYSGCRTLMRA